MKAIQYHTQCLKLVKAVTIVISVLRPSSTVPLTYTWPVFMTAVLAPTRLCCTGTDPTHGWATHTIDIPIILCFWGLPWLSLLNQHYRPMCGKTYNTEDNIGSNVLSHLSVVFVLYIVSAISSHLRTLGICA